MIDLNHERLLTLSQAAALIPKRRGQKVRTTTIWRWIVRGKRGVRLEGYRTPAGWCTSAEAIGRFFDALSRKARGELLGGLPDDSVEPVSPSYSTSQVGLTCHETPEHVEAVEELKRKGVIK